MYNRSLLDVDGDVLLGTTTGSRATLTMNGGILRLHGGGLRYVNGDISVLSGRIEGVGELDWSSLFTQFGGTLAPGLDGEAGVTDILRSYRVYGMGEVEIEVGNLNAGGDEYDRLIVGQTALLGGKLVLKLMDNARFQAGQEITIMTAGQLIGEFGSVVQPFDDGLGDVFDVVYGDGSVKLVALRAVPAPAPGMVMLAVAGVGMLKRRRGR